MSIFNLFKKNKEKHIEDMVFCGRCKYHIGSEMVVGHSHRCMCPGLQEVPYCDITPIRAESEQPPTYCEDANKNNDCTFYESERWLEAKATKRRIPMGNKPVMYEWPESQMCMDCKHGEFIMSDKLVNSNYLCMVGCDKSDGVICPKLEPKVEEK